jgi:DNA replication protein DnaC
MMTEVCAKCDGMGMVVVRRADGGFAAEPCDCRDEVKALARLERARIPERYRNCTLRNFERLNESLQGAFIMAETFVTDYTSNLEGKGLLFTGSMGVGKTHLAVGLIHALITERSVSCLFCDYRELLKQIQESYNASTQVTELQVLQPIFNTEVLLIDDLGYIRPTEWVWDTVALILNSRYNAKRTTIITTNYPNHPAGFRESTDKPRSRSQADAERAMREETLGDRIGERMRSRLAEMCVEVKLEGEDLRQSRKRAAFR